MEGGGSGGVAEVGGAGRYPPPSVARNNGPPGRQNDSGGSTLYYLRLFASYIIACPFALRVCAPCFSYAPRCCARPCPRHRFAPSPGAATPRSLRRAEIVECCDTFCWDDTTEPTWRLCAALRPVPPAARQHARQRQRARRERSYWAGGCTGAGCARGRGCGDRGRQQRARSCPAAQSRVAARHLRLALVGIRRVRRMRCQLTRVGAGGLPSSPPQSRCGSPLRPWSCCRCATPPN